MCNVWPRRTDFGIRHTPGGPGDIINVDPGVDAGPRDCIPSGPTASRARDLIFHTLSFPGPRGCSRRSTCDLPHVGPSAAGMGHGARHKAAWQGGTNHNPPDEKRTAAGRQAPSTPTIARPSVPSRARPGC
eukprot:3204886-Prymnesium_polylepis.1